MTNAILGGRALGPDDRAAAEAMGWGDAGRVIVDHVAVGIADFEGRLRAER